MHLLSCNAFIYSLQVLAAVSLVIPKAAAFAEDQDPLPFNDDQTKGTQVGDVYEVNISSTYDKSDIKPVTSEDSKTDTYTLTYVNASYISVHFRQFDLPSSCSLAITTDDNGEEEEQPYILTGQGKFDLGTFWAHHVNGDTMKLSLSCDEEEEKEFALFEIDQFAAGFPLNNNPELHPNERNLRSRRTKKERSVGENKIPSFLKAIDEERKLSICGTDDKRNAICYKDSEPTIYNKAKAVARLLINGRSACTGWLVSEGNLLFTNEHCIDSLSDVQNTDFEFMGEESQCAIGSSDGSWFSSRNRDGIYDGNALLKVSATWDYALIQLSGNPASKYGFLELDNRKASVNEQIYIPQHPGGRPKEIGVIDSNHDGNCRVKGYRRGCAPEDMTYSCDTEGGSSGSPVLSRTNNKVIALHHCGGGCNGNLGAPIYKFYNEINEFLHTTAPTTSPVPTMTHPSVSTKAPTSSPIPTMIHPGVSGYGLGVQDASNYWLAYGIDIPDIVNFRSAAGVPYTDDYSGENDIPLPTTGFNRVGYYLELEKDGEEVQWVWVSFDAFTADIKKIAFPTIASGAIFQEEVTNMNVASSIPALNKEGITGNIEFWPHNYGKNNVKGVSGASNSVYDLGDQRSSGGSYGSMQVHSSELGGTIFAINRWNANTAVDIGIGNNPNGNPDWTFKVNGKSYITKRLEVLVKRTPTQAPTVSAVPTSSPIPTMTHPGVSGYGLGVQDASNYWLAYGIDIPDIVNFRSAAGVPYTDDYSGENDIPLPTTGFNRVGYYLELEKDGEVQWVWVSFDAFTADIKKIAFPTIASGAIFQEEVTNMNVASSIPALNKEGITGNIEFWPHNYGKNNVKGVSGASNSVYDLGDQRSSGGSYGSMQVHSSELGGTIFAINRWNANTAVDIGIGNNPNGNPDWTFKVNGNSYTTKRLEVLVKHAPTQ